MANDIVMSVAIDRYLNFQGVILIIEISKKWTVYKRLNLSAPNFYCFA